MSHVDWHGLYPTGASYDSVLFPRQRRAKKAASQTSLMDVAEDGTPDTIVHPAKMSLPLLDRILTEMMERGWLKPGDCLVDPFGGRGSTAAVWCAKDPQNRAVTCEIEPHFAEMQRSVKVNAERKLGRPLQWEIIQGDSRKLDELMGVQGESAVLSPPYENALNSEQHGIDWSKAGAWRGGRARGEGTAHERTLQSSLGYSAILSPPYEDSLSSDDPEKRGGLFRDPKRANDRTLTGNYGGLVSLTSPPYGDVNPAKSSGGVDMQKNWESYRASGGGSSFEAYCEQQARHSQHYGDTPGQIGRLPDAAVTSPPYEAQSGGAGEASQKGMIGEQSVLGRHAASNAAEAYGETNGQIGATQGETYADACLAVYSALARAGVRYLAVVTKNPTRDGKLRRLDKLTARLLRQSGYRIVTWRRAWLWETETQRDEREGQDRLDSDMPAGQRPQGRLSFFKRIWLAKGAVSAQWEDVFFCELRVAVGDGAASVTSPPYGDSQVGTGQGERRGWRGYTDFDGGTFSTPGQIASLRDPIVEPAPLPQIIERATLPPLTRDNAVAEWSRLSTKRRREGLTAAEEERWMRACEMVDAQAPSRFRR